MSKSPITPPAPAPEEPDEDERGDEPNAWERIRAEAKAELSVPRRRHSRGPRHDPPPCIE